MINRDRKTVHHIDTEQDLSFSDVYKAYIYHSDPAVTEKGSMLPLWQHVKPDVDPTKDKVWFENARPLGKIL